MKKVSITVTFGLPLSVVQEIERQKEPGISRAMALETEIRRVVQKYIVEAIAKKE